YLASGSPGRARVEALSALVLQPDVKVDSSIFPPSVDALVSELKKSPTPGVPVSVDAFPRGAAVTIDDRPIAGGVSLRPGRHWLVARAEGSREVVRALDIHHGVP